MNLIAIIVGNTINYLNIRTSIMVHREEEYCKKCPMSHINGVYTGVCDKSLGCGCPIKAKTSQSIEPCPLGFWKGNKFYKEKFNTFLHNHKY